ncbi:hypothetical protein DFH06DRAFT_710604 [Mycena polygramma]|nr:hypothetical protein DFH06DRAFT_710604 [Mycena polygramma]
MNERKNKECVTSYVTRQSNLVSYSMQQSNAPVLAASKDLPESLIKWLAYSNAEEERRAAAAAKPPPPRPRVDFEMPPPIAEHLLDCECVYGYDLADAWMQAYFDAHPSEEPLPPHTSLLWRSRKRQTVRRAAEVLGLDVYFESIGEDIIIAYFSFTEHGNVRMRVPTAPHLQGLCEVLGIKEEARWFGTKVQIQRVAEKYATSSGRLSKYTSIPKCVATSNIARHRRAARGVSVSLDGCASKYVWMNASVKTWP